eukprot:6192610-Pleurochrysis_carterae.AAC.1
MRSAERVAYPPLSRRAVLPPHALECERDAHARCQPECDVRCGTASRGDADRCRGGGIHARQNRARVHNKHLIDLPHRRSNKIKTYCQVSTSSLCRVQCALAVVS